MCMGPAECLWDGKKGGNGKLEGVDVLLRLPFGRAAQLPIGTSPKAKS
jgi:hypothetical protein